MVCSVENLLISYNQLIYLFIEFDDRRGMVDILIQGFIFTSILWILTCLIFNNSLINKQSIIWSLDIGTYLHVFVYRIVLCNWRPLVCHLPS